MAQRLRRLGVRGGGEGGAAQSLANRPESPPVCRRGDERALAARLGAEVVCPGVLRLVREQALHVLHGHARLEPEPDPVALLLPDAPLDPARWVAIDTETSGLAGGTGTWAFAVGVGRWRGGRIELVQVLLTRLDAEAAFLRCMMEELADAELLLSYNGKGFDLPLLAARLRLSRLADGGLPRLAHLDLLHPVRRAFARRWSDCRLASVEGRLLGLRRQGDLPGAEAPAAWLDWLRLGNGRRLGAVLAHNRVDLLSVMALPAALQRVYRSPTRFDADAGRIARWHLARSDVVAALEVLQPIDALEPAARHLLARLHARAGGWGAAVSIWQTMAQSGDPEAHEALAKHFEHRVGDPTRALQHAHRLPPGEGRERRILRLLAKSRRRC